LATLGTWSFALNGCAREPVQGAILTDPAQRISSVERFAGETRVRTAQGVAAVRVDVRNWTLGGGLKLDELPLQAKGLMIVQLRSGQVTTVIDGKREARKEGQFWTVAEGVRMSLETGDDSAILQTIVIVRP
jgi:hypothetical protein